MLIWKIFHSKTTTMQKPLYLLKGTLYRNKDKNSKLVEINEAFMDDHPIVARDKAFRTYQNYVDVLLESKNANYLSHQQAESVLQPFLDSGKREFVLNNPSLEMDSDFDKGLHLYFIPNPDKKSYTKENEIYYPEKYCIHIMDNKKEDLRRYILNSLIFECDYYTKHKFVSNDQETWTYKRDTSGKMKKISILSTPLTDLLDIL